MLNPTLFEKTKKQLEKYKITRKLNIKAVSKNENDKLKELDQLAKESIEILKNRFKNKYDVQIEEEHNAYLGLKESKESFDNQKYEIFYKLFLKQTN